MESLPLRYGGDKGLASNLTNARGKQYGENEKSADHLNSQTSRTFCYIRSLVTSKVFHLP